MWSPHVTPARGSHWLCSSVCLYSCVGWLAQCVASNWPALWVISFWLVGNICNVTTDSHLDCTNFYQWTAFSSTLKYHRPNKVISVDRQYFGTINQESDSPVSHVQLWFLISLMKNTPMSECHSHMRSPPWYQDDLYDDPLMLMMLLQIINMLGVCHPDNECNCTLVTLVSADQCPESRSPRYQAQKVSVLFIKIFQECSPLFLHNRMF